MASEGEEPPEEKKKVLLPLLEQFLNILPDKETFRSWLQEKL